MPVAPNPTESHRVRLTLGERLARFVPFGIGRRKPKRFRDMLGTVWGSRDNLPYAWKVLTRAVGDGCAPGVPADAW
jgi:hypothetical protein